MARTATQYLRGLVNRQIKRMERRGYTISSEVKDSIKNAKYQTLKSLQRDRYRKLYEKSTATTDTGEEVSGTRRRIQERRESTRKAQETRRRKAEIEQQEQEQERQRRWEEERRLKDEEDRQRAWQVNEGEIIYDKIMKMIDGYPTNNAMKLRSMLSNDISKYGFNHVMMSLANAPAEAISHAETIIYTISDHDTAQVIHAAFVDFANIIRGTKATTEEAKEMGDAMDEMTDFETFK